MRDATLKMLPVMGDMEGRLCFRNQANSEGWNPRISLNFAFRAVRLTIRINVRQRIKALLKIWYQPLQ
jgi:hypothetical protein